MRLVLASASPGRAGILRQLGFRFDIVPSNIAEDIAPGGDPARAVESLALGKARRVASLEPDAIVLAADTVIVLDDAILAKPASEEDARAMLERMSGRWHEVISGLAAVDARSGREASCYEVTRVRMAELGPELIERYVGTGEPLGKAGAYAIQGRGALLVDTIAGCYFNVVGLPVARLRQVLARVGVSLDDLLDSFACDEGRPAER